MKIGKNYKKIIPLFLASSVLANCAPLSLTPSFHSYHLTPNPSALEQAVLKYKESEDFVPMHEKADYFLQQIENYHITPEGLLAYSTNINKSRPKQPFVNSAGDMALFTSLYLAAESFRYAATKDPAALGHVKRTLTALRNLQKVTGVEGLVARYYAKPESTRKKALEGRFVYEGRGEFDGYKWLGDVSNDQMAGIYFAYGIAYDLVEEDDAQKMISEDVGKITDHMIKNGMRFRDANGKYTRFTNMTPEGLVEINKMLALSFLKTAHHITKKKEYKDKYNELIYTHNYHKRMKVLKPALVTKTLDVENHFNDNIIFLGLFNLTRYGLENGDILGIYRQAMEHSWVNYSRGEANSLFNIIYNTLTPNNEYAEESLQEALASLILMPLEKRNVKVENSKRKDICVRKVLDESLKKELRACAPLPMDERPIHDFAWQRNPYELDGGSEKPDKEYTGLDFLLPYWMARYYRFIAESQ